MCLALSSLAIQSLIAGIKCNAPPPLTGIEKGGKRSFSCFPLPSFLYSPSLLEVKSYHYVFPSILKVMKLLNTPLHLTLSKMLTNLDRSQDLPFSSPLFRGLREAIVAMVVMHILPCRNGEVVGVSWQRMRVFGHLLNPSVKTKLDIASWSRAKSERNTLKIKRQLEKNELFREFQVSDMDVTIAWVACLFYDRNINVTAAYDAQSLSL